MSNGVHKKFNKLTKQMGYKPGDPALISQLVEGMKKMLADPNSEVNQYTKQCRANGIHCMQDDLDAGQSLEDICRRSVFVK